MKSGPDATNTLSKSALWFVWSGAAVALGLTFWMGHRNPSPLLVVMFLLWVASPFAGLIQVHRLGRAWPAARQMELYILSHLVSVASVLAYAAAVFLMHLAKPAGPFLVVPAVSWLVIAFGLSMSRYFHRGRAPD
jgi:hypothetical protein